MAAVAIKERKRKWSYGHFRCTERLRETIAKYAQQNGRTFSDEIVTSLEMLYDVKEEEKPVVLPPLLQQIQQPTQGRPGRRH